MPHEILVHEGAGHSFMNARAPGPLVALGRLTPMRAAYDAEAVAWRARLAFLERHLLPPPG